MNDIIIAENLKKQFEDVTAVADISFRVRSGEVLGFLGPNGAGKTTTINMLTGLARPDAGSIHIAGIDCLAETKHAQQRIGIVPDESNLYPELTGFENLCFCASLYGIGRAERVKRATVLLDAFGLSAAAHRKFGGYSKGMKRRLTIAAGVIHHPDILFLDEPTMGIDVAGARLLRQKITDLHEKGTTIFLTTHYIEEAERLCDRVAFIVSGRIVCLDDVAALLEPIQDKYAMLLVCTGLQPDSIHSLGKAFPDMECERSAADAIRVQAAAPIHVAPLARFLEDHGVGVLEARRLRPSLEEVFVKVTGIGANVMDGNGAVEGDA